MGPKMIELIAFKAASMVFPLGTDQKTIDAVFHSEEGGRKFASATKDAKTWADDRIRVYRRSSEWKRKSEETIAGDLLAGLIEEVRREIGARKERRLPAKV